MNFFMHLCVVLLKICKLKILNKLKMKKIEKNETFSFKMA